MSEEGSAVAGGLTWIARLFTAGLRVDRLQPSTPVISIYKSIRLVFAAVPPGVRRWLCLAGQILSLDFGERLCLEPFATRGGASKIKGKTLGKAQPFRTSGGTAAKNPVFKLV